MDASTPSSSSEMELANKKCGHCDSKDIGAMSEQTANELLQQIPGWSILNDDGKPKLHRSWKAKSFKKGLELFQCVSDIAEAEGGLSENDFILAAKISALDLEPFLRKKAAAK